MRLAHTASLLTVAAAAALLASCGGGYGGTGPVAYCSAVRPIAISITVRDSVSQHAAADSASGMVFSVNGTETLIRADTLILFGGSTLGSYDVAVQRPGYRTWSRANVQVTRTGTCGSPETVKLTALLQRP